MNDTQKFRMYGLTAIACFAWVIQTLYQAIQKDQLWTWMNLVFYCSMLLVIIYTSISAYQCWKLSKNKGEK